MAPFDSRKQLLRVKGLGPKAFEQAAGFLRLPDAPDPLDHTAIHPRKLRRRAQADRSLWRWQQAAQPARRRSPPPARA